jgi:hypothetical protein
MKKWFFAVSLLIVLVGVVMVSQNSLARTTWKEDLVMAVPGGGQNGSADVEDSWNVSANLEKGDVIHVYFTQGAQWRQGLFDIDEDFPGFAILYVGVNVTDPHGNTTIYLCIMGKPDSEGPETILNVLDVNITSDEGGIDPSWLYRNATNSYYGIGGAVQFSGTYNFTVGNLWPGRNDPPSSISIRKVTFATEHPYTYLLPSGIGVAGVGAVLALFSLRKKTKQNLDKKAKPR